MTNGLAPLPHVGAAHAVLVNGAEALDMASRTMVAVVRSHSPTDPMTAKDTYGWVARMLMDYYRSYVAAGNAPCESALNLGIVSAGIQELGVADGIFPAALACLTDERKAITVIHWADTLVRTNRAANALALLEKSAVEFPDHIDTQWAVARTLAQLGQFAKARERYDALIGKVGDDESAMNLLQTERDALPTQ